MTQPFLILATKSDSYHVRTNMIYTRKAIHHSDVGMKRTCAWVLSGGLDGHQ